MKRADFRPEWNNGGFGPQSPAPKRSETEQVTEPEKEAEATVKPEGKNNERSGK